MHKAFFLDRDGTINVDYNFVHRPKEWTWCDGAVEAIQWMNRNDFKVIVVTNQSGISRGHYTVEEVEELHQWVDNELKHHQAHIDEWYMAPYHPEFCSYPPLFDVEDRKPGLGMFQKAADKYDIDFSRSYMAGDKISDLKPAIELGIKPFFIRSRHEPSQNKQWLAQHGIQPYDTLSQAVDTLK